MSPHDKIFELENRVSELEKICRNLIIRSGLEHNRSQMFQSLFSDFVFEMRCITSPSQLSTDEVIQASKAVMLNYAPQRLHDTDNIFYDLLAIVFASKPVPFPYKTADLQFDCACLWGLGRPYESMRMILSAIQHNKPILYAETGFLECILPAAYDSQDFRFKQFHSIVLDSRSVYYDARHETDLEIMLNTVILDEEELNRSKSAINKIIVNSLSKYNHQPIVTPEIKTSKKKVLVIDQVVGDGSITYGMATEETFDHMLDAARNENPGAEIMVKIHPDTHANFRGRHYENLPSDIHIIDYDMNPISLLQAVDVVYVCTSQLGFEALMCGKEVHVFGLPFYAGWGVTQDRLSCPRRNKKRSVEEIFYISYILYSKYVSYKDHAMCEIEQVIDELLELRAEYWAETP